MLDRHYQIWLFAFLTRVFLCMLLLPIIWFVSCVSTAFHTLFFSLR